MRLLSGLWILRQDRGKANHGGKLLLHSPGVPRQGFQDVDDVVSCCIHELPSGYVKIAIEHWMFMGFLWDLRSGND